MTLNQTCAFLWNLINNNYTGKSYHPIKLPALKLHTAAAIINRCTKNSVKKWCWSKKYLFFKNIFCWCYCVFKIQFQIPFLGHCVSLICESSCNHTFLRRYYIYFRRALVAINCVLTMYLTDSSISDVLLFILSRVLCIYLTILIVLMYQIKWMMVVSGVLKWNFVYLRKAIAALLYQ